MPSLSPCGNDLVMVITGLPEIPFLIFSIVGSVRVNGSISMPKSPMPDGTTSIDHIVRNPDTLTVTAIQGCAGCRTLPTDFLPMLQLLKRAMSAQVYDATFANLFWNYGAATNMVLKSYSTRVTQQDVQIQEFVLNFEAANIQGEIQAPSFRAGGILA